MGANTTSLTGTTVTVTLHSTHDTDWVWTTEAASPTGDTSARMLLASIEINPAAANCDITIRDESSTGAPLMIANMTDTDDNRFKNFMRGNRAKPCRPYITASDCTNSGSATIQFELA